jgi:hypothetical protein
MPKTTVAETTPPSFSLLIEGGNPAAEVVLLDHRLRLIERAIGRLQTTKPAGVYRAKVVLGRQTDERAILLDHDTTETFAEPVIASPAPLFLTSQTHEFQIHAAQRESQTVRFAYGHGATIFVFVRRWTPGPGRSITAREFVHPARGLSLWTGNGRRRLADLERHSALGPGWDGWAGLTVSVDPGAYTLRYRAPSGRTLEQTLIASKDWQTQVFVSRTPRPESATQGSEDAEFANLTILMSQSYFDPTQDDMRLAEIARLALVDGRRVVSQELRTMLDRKHENPMLGLYGAHLMLEAHERMVQSTTGPTERKWADLNEASDLGDGLMHVVGNLRDMLGRDHPDVEALSLKLDDPAQRTQRTFTEPPMLRRSWSLIVEASNDKRDICERKVWERISRMTALQPFLSWVKPPRRGTSAQLEESLKETLKAYVALATDPTALATTTTERAIGMAEMAGPAAGMFPMRADDGDDAASAPGAPPARDDDAIGREVSLAMDVPRFVVDEAQSA